MKSKYSEVHQGIAIYGALIWQMLAWPMFTPLEHRIVNLITQGNKNQEIAVICGTTELVIKNYVRRIFDKTGMSSRLQLALWYTKRQFEESMRGVRRHLRWTRHPGPTPVPASDQSDGQTKHGRSRP